MEVNMGDHICEVMELTICPPALRIMGAETEAKLRKDFILHVKPCAEVHPNMKCSG